MQVYCGTIIHSKSISELEILQTAAIGVARGTIQFLETLSASKTLEQSEILLLLKELANKHGFDVSRVVYVEAPQFLCPGLIDTHTHAPQHLCAGTGMDLTLLKWLETYTFPTEAKFKDPEFAARNYKKVVKQNIDAGTTSAVYFGTLHLDATKVLADIVRESGARSFVGKVNMDRNCPEFYIEETHDSIRDTKVFVDYVHSFQNDLVTPCLTPRFVPTCTPELMDFLGKMSRDYKLPIQSHVSENPGEVEWVKSLHPECKGYAGTVVHPQRLRG